MGARHLDVLGRHVDAVNRSAEPGHRFAQNAAAASDIQHGEPLERRPGGGIAAKGVGKMDQQVIATQLIEFVQRPKRSGSVPPRLRERLVVGDLARIDVYLVVLQGWFRVQARR